LLGKKAIGVEIDEKYAEIAANRLSQKTLFWKRSDTPPSQETQWRVVKPVTVPRIQPLVKSITDGRLINRLNRRLMAYYWHGDKPCKTLQIQRRVRLMSSCQNELPGSARPMQWATWRNCRKTHDPTASTYGVNGCTNAIPCPLAKPVWICQWLL
jgi:hypothetical protein